MDNLAEIKGLLFDLDGVLYIGSEAIAGAVEAVQLMRTLGIPCRLITNTSTISVGRCSTR